MAMNNDGEIDGYSFLWKIENISNFRYKTKDQISSPVFTADELEGTKWVLCFYPAGYNLEYYVNFYLQRDEHCDGPQNFAINYQLAIVDKEGAILSEKISSGSFKKNDDSSSLVDDRKKVFITDRESFIPGDTLTLKCTIWKEDAIPVKHKRLFARTAFNVQRRSFVLKIYEFSALKPGVINKFKDDLMEFDLVLDKGLDSERKLSMDVLSLDENIKHFSFNTSITDSEGKKEDCGSHEYFDDELKKKIITTLLFTNRLTENKSRYLPNDVLSLDCEYLYSTGAKTTSYGFCDYELTAPEPPKAVEEAQNTELTPVLANDLKSVYIDGVLSDAELRTSSKTFPAHKIILSARSPVFRRMFSNDMKENNSGHVDITDFEDDTIHRMLLYMYTDTLEDLQFEGALKLYMIADKYEILTLRNKCSLFLKDNMCPSQVCDILAVADLHQDNELQNAAESYILKYEKEVFGSEEWKNFMDTHSKLAVHIMYRKGFD